jgi:beta-glucosidase
MSKHLVFAGILLAALSAGAGLSQAPTGQDWRDLNHNGRLDPYEDARLPRDKRVADLLEQMTLAEKVGLMLHGTLPGEGGNPMGRGQAYDRDGAARLIQSGVNSFITRLDTDPARFAEENNAIQTLAEQSRLGIPVTISTDPRNHFQVTLGASSAGGGFSQWPETLGMAAIGDEALVEKFGRIAAREYRAVGIHMALSPQADLYTEPRWPRGTATFGSDPATVSRLAGAYVRGFQGSARGLAPGGVATVVKHWAGYGAEPDGFDGHNWYGRTAQLDSASFRQHLAAFNGALAARSAGVMPTYVIPRGGTRNGKPLPLVGGGFNKPLIEGLLRQDRHFEGLVVSDWGITNTCPEQCRTPTKDKPQGFAIAMPWGVEDLLESDRFAMGANAGIDQFGGVADPAPLLLAIKAGKLSVARVDAAARRVLSLKFQLGLFDNSFVDPQVAARVLGDPQSTVQAEAAQRAAQVLLENRGTLLPLAAPRKLWLSVVSADAARAAGYTVVDDIAQADAAIVRVATPHEVLHPNHFFGPMQHEGRLDFRPDDEATRTVAYAASRVPTVVAVDLDRAAVLTVLNDALRQSPRNALFGLFGASDAVLLDLVSGRARPQGHLPFELPSSAQAVAEQHPARADDSRNPLYRRGAGLTYP